MARPYSEGVILSRLVNDGWGENQDGYDTIEWAAANRGLMVMSGCTAVHTGRSSNMSPPPRGHLSLKACVPIYGGGARDISFPGGAYRLQDFSGWAVWMGINCLPGLTTHEDKEQIRLRLNQTWAEIELGIGTFR